MTPSPCTQSNDLPGRAVLETKQHGAMWEDLRRRSALARTPGTAEHAALTAAIWHEFPEVFSPVAEAQAARKSRACGRVLAFPRPISQIETRAKCS